MVHITSLSCHNRKYNLGLILSLGPYLSGIELEYWVSSSDGPPRDIEISIGEYQAGSFTELQRFPMKLDQGVRNLDFKIPNP